MTKNWDEFVAAAGVVLCNPSRVCDDLGPHPEGATGAKARIDDEKARRLDYLTLSRFLLKELEYNQHRVVDELRELGAKWREIAEALDVSNSAVQQRFRKPEEEPGDEGFGRTFDVQDALDHVHDLDRPIDMARHGLISWAEAADMRGYPSPHELRRARDRDYSEYDGVDYLTQMTSPSTVALKLVVGEIVATGESSRATYAQESWAALSEEKQRDWIDKILSVKGEQFGEDASFTAQRLEELTAEYTAFRDWISSTSRRLQVDLGEEPAEFVELRNEFGVLDDGSLIEPHTHQWDPPDESS